MVIPRFGGGTTETRHAAKLRVVVDDEVGEVAKAPNTPLAPHDDDSCDCSSAVAGATEQARKWRAAKSTCGVRARLSCSTPRPFNASQRRELDRREANRPGPTSPGTEGKPLGREKFNGERPARACWSEAWETVPNCERTCPVCKAELLHSAA